MYSKRQLSNIIYFLEDARSCLRVGDNLSDLLQSIVKLFRTKASFQSAALVLLGDGKRVAGTACWSEDPYLPESVLYQWFAASEDVLGSCLEKGGILTDESAARCLPAADPSKLDLLVVPVLLDKTTLGAIFFNKSEEELTWTAVDRKYGRVLGLLLGVLFAEKVGSGSKFRGQALRTTADGIDIGTCIIDLQTDHILYMNQNMKNAFNLQGVEGLPCWQVLRVGQEGRCAKCPIFGLKETLKSSFLCSWEERSVLNGHIYKNFMGLLYWGKNSVVSLLQSVEKMELL